MIKVEFLDLPPIAGSNFERDYSFVDYKGKVVLDVGADYGSSAAYFLRRGASKVVAVEGNEEFFRQLEENVNEVSEVTAIRLWINTPMHFEELIKTHSPDIVKVDCEGCEVHLLGVDARVLTKVREYVLEVHSNELMDKFAAKFQRLGYTLAHVHNWTGEVRIVYAMPTQLFFAKRRREMGLC